MLKKKILLTTILLSVVGSSGLGMFASHAVAGTIARVAAGHAVLRTGPTTAYKVIATVPAGAKVQINGCLPNKSWCSLRYHGKVGWVPARYLSVNNVPTISFAHRHVKPHSTMKAQKEKMKPAVPGSKAFTGPQKKRQHLQKLYRTDMIIDSTGVKKRDERTIFNPSSKAQGVSVKHVTAYNPFFPDDVNFRNFERNETRYRIVTYPAPSR
ncbi:SH3 domain-containing protein [Bartonella doshiae]|uniref:Uncharacterized protein with a bacterial SH3 domain homologue n=2 Tax=Bartonella doshiae TaxID=33044 RepID=A0A380ZEE8_BARDO|nr:SH3 domain-containing protein [Bartonella doshiae]EJF81192.1 hypothetical protein MCS_00905 [Bartonella doshiae NCTC 12862 = ATCC 700133]MBB6159826.1 uncharacterized protein YraI [Bartonella doshiae]SUV45343.1 Uncharacterized protein with a bacterial SH3 domain homologue [Bartonella doshiae]